jgi:hypothetical protein
MTFAVVDSFLIRRKCKQYPTGGKIDKPRPPAWIAPACLGVVLFIAASTAQQRAERVDFARQTSRSSKILLRLPRPQTANGRAAARF